MVHFGEFLKPEACGQTLLPDRSILIEQNWRKMPKFKYNILSNFQTMWVHAHSKIVFKAQA